MSDGSRIYEKTFPQRLPREKFWNLALTRTPDPNRPTRRGIFLETRTNRYSWPHPTPGGGSTVGGGQSQAGISLLVYPRTMDHGGYDWKCGNGKCQPKMQGWNIQEWRIWKRLCCRKMLGKRQDQVAVSRMRLINNADSIRNTNMSSVLSSLCTQWHA